MASPGAGGAGRPGWVAALVQAAYRLPWSYRDELLRLGIVPALISFAIELIDTLLGTDNLSVVLGLADIVPFTMFQVAVYRLLLLGPGAVTPGIKPTWGRRELRFLGVNLAIGLAFVVIILVVAAAARRRQLHQRPDRHAGAGLSRCSPSMPTAAFRWSFPAIAVDHPLRLCEAARCTRPVGGRLWLALILSAVPVVLLMVVVSKFLGASGLAGAAPLATAFILVVLGYAATAIMLVPIALAFRELCGWSGPPAPAWNGR